MKNIKVKSIVNNRVRLKSDIFKDFNNNLLIQKELNDVFLSFRENVKCKSIIFTHDLKFTLDEILEKIDKLFSNKTNISMSILAAGAVCDTSGVCNICELKDGNKKQNWKRKLIEFGFLTGFAIYIFVKETILGVTLATSPFSLIAVVSMVAALPLLKESYDDIKQGKFTLHTFMGGTLVLAIFFGEVTAAFEIIYILRGGMLLEEYIATRSKDEIHKLVELDVTKVYKLVDGIEMEVDFDEITYEDILVIRSGEKIPVDGIIDSGNAEINEAIINGRSEPDFKEAGDEVYAGTICDKGRIYIKVTALGNETYISRTMREVEASLALKSPSEVEADKLASKLLKLGSVLTIGTFALTGSFINAFAVMIVMSCPCATVLAASTAISAGISNGAKNGILIKGGEALENVSKAEVFCFDKTGTLTTGKPIIVDIITANGISEDEILRYAAIAEFRNSHPIAKAIISHAKEKTIQIDQSGEGEIIPGFGVKTKNKNETILVGNRKLFTKNKISTKEYTEATKKHLHKGKTVVYVARDKEVLGFITFKHEVRPGTKQMIEELRNKGVKHIALLTGDELKVANSFALDFGFDSVFANQTPEGKADAIDELKKTYKKVVMVGDGVNDTYAMSKADVAISFAAAGSEAAIAVSDIAITHSHPEDITYLYDLSEKSLKVVNQNYWIGTGTNLIGVGFAGIGLLSPVAAGAIHIGHTIGIMANSSKLALSKNHNQVDTFEVL